MRIIECYVSAFGGLKNRRFQFGEGLNPFIGKNGAGKTTLTVFIKAMLYGIGDTKKASIEENDRKHYLPRDGAIMGGSLTFVQKGKQYRIERTFGKKASDDTIAVFEASSGKQTSVFGDRPAEKIFSINAMGFERTVFLSEKNLSPKSSPESITLKLSEDSGQGLDSADLERAKKIIDEQRKFYYKKGGGGEISATRAEISRIDARIEELKDTENRLNTVLDKLDGLEKQLAYSAALREEISKRRSSLAMMDARSELQARTNRLKKEICELEERRGEILIFFNGSVPDYEEIERYSVMKKEAELLIRGSKSREYDREHEGLRSLFTGRCTPLEVEAAKEVISDIELLEEKKRDLIISEGVLQDADLDSRKIESVALSLQSSFKRGNGAKIFMSVFWVLAAIGAILMGYFLNPYFYPAVVPCAVLSLCFTASLLVMRVKRRKALKNAVRFLSQYYSVPIDQSEAHNKLSILLSIAQKIEIYGEKIKKCEEYLGAFVDKFITRGGMNPKSLAFELISKYDRFIALESASRITEITDRDIERGMLLESNVKNFLSRYNTDESDPFMQIKSYEREYRLLTARIISLRGEMESGGAGYGINDRDTAEISDTEASIKSDEEELEMRIRNINMQSALLEDEKGRLENALSELDGLTAEKKLLEQRLSDYESTLRIISLTGEFLTRAEENMSSRYIDKSRESFRRYTQFLRPDSVLRADINSDLETTVSDGGATYSSDVCSRGERELYGLCARLSLIDALYDGEDVPVILDDPFISFDDAAVKNAKALVQRVAAEKQVIYFTCSESRGFNGAVKI